MKGQPSLLLIAHTYAIAEHAKKLPELAWHFDLTCATVVTSGFHGHYGLDGDRFGGAAETGDFECYNLDVVGSVASVTRFFMRGLGAILRSRRWDYVLVENEPWSFLKWQALIQARHSGQVRCFGEFTWENVLRPGLKGIILKKVYQLSARSSDFFICGNKAASRIVISAGMPEDRVLVCPQVGVDPRHDRPIDGDQRVQLRRETGLPEQAFIIGFAGRLVEEKGVLDLLRTMESLPAAERGGTFGVHLALKGHGHLRAQLQAKAATVDWLHVFDPVPHHELPAFLQTLDLLVLGSHPVQRGGTYWEEQFGHIMIEAIASGALAAGSSSGAIPEVLDDPDLIFPPGDIAAVGRLINKLRADPAWAAEKKTEQQKLLQDRYTHAAVAERLAEFLKSRFP
ncbi:MAG: glycosyltransferase [Verrucomicrobia bacterium]|nr:glycosyltransferase [Verrucomicrobiota bacterium]